MYTIIMPNYNLNDHKQSRKQDKSISNLPNTIKGGGGL